jgi:hypothetical protein
MKFFGIAILLFFVGCKNHTTPKTITPAFYFWKSNFNLTANEKQTLQTLNVNTLYLKYFDVVWNTQTQKPQPIAQIEIKDSRFLSNQKIKIIPTIFITNETLSKINKIEVPNLATSIISLAQKITSLYNLTNITQIQIDCDWTASTKEKYFELLSTIQTVEKAIPISVTIRLHQVKYLQQTGVPPVKQGMLMCYNMGNLTNVKTNNSIIEISEMKQYISQLKNYPIKLDVALPLFDWIVWFNNNRFKGLINIENKNLFNASFSHKKANKIFIEKDTTIQNFQFKKGDVLRIEESTLNVINQAAKILAKEIKQNNLTLSLYHLDSLTLNKFTTNELESIFNSMRK